jgi:1-acyl-sn-glycerol-3-phosphate acyltransferase
MPIDILENRNVMDITKSGSSDSFIDWYKLVCSILGIYVHTLIRKVQIQGEELIPSGPKIIVANHANLTDSFILPHLFSEKLHFLIQADIFDIPVLGKLLTLADQIPTQKGSGRDALQRAQQWLERGNSVVIFPEGRMNNGGELFRAGVGAAVLAAQTNLPLVPLGFFVPDRFTRLIARKYQDRPAYGSFQFGGTCYIQVGEPWLMAQRNKLETTRPNLRDTTNQIMDYIAELIDMAREFAGYPRLKK